MTQEPMCMLRFSEFLALRTQRRDSQSEPNPEPQRQLTETRISAAALQTVLPVVLTFQRTQLIPLSDGEAIATYREAKTGRKIVLQSRF